jgi:iron only hydrogenase large subunit-like protein
VDGSATVMSEACILCGRCTQVCPVGAKKIRDDLAAATALVKSGKAVYVSLAPSWRTEFSSLPQGKLINAIKSLGFTGVSETALGAQAVSAACATLLSKSDAPFLISSACPSVIHLIEQYYPALVPYITGLTSPLQAHVKQLKDLYGADCGIVFIGPCIAKKNEVNGDFDMAITFSDLRRWFIDKGIDWMSLDEEASFIPLAAEEGSLYPIDGGMVEGVRACGAPDNTMYMSFSGIEEIIAAFKDLDVKGFSRPVFIEALACIGGCVNGPVASQPGLITQKRYKVETESKPRTSLNRLHEPDIAKEFSSREVNKNNPGKAEIASALMRIGKKSKEEELNCGGCGYNTCREFAIALLDNNAEPAMCVSYLRKLAQNKASALIKAMPSGVVIVDENLKIIESNKQFIKLIGGDANIVSEADPDLEGAYLERLVPFSDLFVAALKSGTEATVTDIRHQGKIIRLTLFSIQPQHILGGILQDITEPEIQREQIIAKAGEVMKKNLNTVQQIAFLLGENAADSEVLLSSIIESFSGKEKA